MAHDLIFDPSIPDDLVNTLYYYEAISPTLANRLRVGIDKRLDDIADRPESFPFDVRPIRFARLERFPYVIFFVVRKSHVIILAIVHGSSEPKKWRERL